jgi:hypothetical protein
LFVEPRTSSSFFALGAILNPLDSGFPFFAPNDWMCSQWRSRKLSMHSRKKAVKEKFAINTANERSLHAQLKASTAGIRRSLAGKMTWCLIKIGVIEECGRRGRDFLYKTVP